MPPGLHLRHVRDNILKNYLPPQVGEYKFQPTLSTTAQVRITTTVPNSPNYWPHTWGSANLNVTLGAPVSNHPVAIPLSPYRQPGTYLPKRPGQPVS